jgi:hypothetical protein
MKERQAGRLPLREGNWWGAEREQACGLRLTVTRGFIPTSRSTLILGSGGRPDRHLGKMAVGDDGRYHGNSKSKGTLVLIRHTPKETCDGLSF